MWMKLHVMYPLEDRKKIVFINYCLISENSLKFAILVE